MKTVLVTGSDGFLGAPCVSLLVESGFEVHGASINHSAASPGFTPHRVDLTDLGAIATLLEQVQPTHLLHLAWDVREGNWLSGTENLLWVSRSLDLLTHFARVGGTRAVIAGSAHEYDLRCGYCTETLTPCRPSTTYGRSKDGLRRLACEFSRIRGISLGWARLFWVYGPGEHPWRFVPSVIRGALVGVEVALSSGLSFRDYVYVQDAANALVRFLDSALDGPMNIGSGVALQLKDIIHLIVSSTGGGEHLRLGSRPESESEPRWVVANIDRLTSELGWTQQWDPTRGLAETIAWWRPRVAGKNVI